MEHKFDKDSDECKACSEYNDCASGNYSFLSSDESEALLAKMNATEEEFQRTLNRVFEEHKIETKLDATVLLTSTLYETIANYAEKIVLVRALNKAARIEERNSFLGILLYIVNETEKLGPKTTLLHKATIVYDMVLPFTRVILNKVSAEEIAATKMLQKLKAWYESETANIS